jgi:hypothetical protein
MESHRKHILIQNLISAMSSSRILLGPPIHGNREPILEFTIRAVPWKLKLKRMLYMSQRRSSYPIWLNYGSKSWKMLCSNFAERTANSRKNCAN